MLAGQLAGKAWDNANALREQAKQNGSALTPPTNSALFRVRPAKQPALIASIRKTSLTSSYMPSYTRKKLARQKLPVLRLSSNTGISVMLPCGKSGLSKTLLRRPHLQPLKHSVITHQTH
jgi:hypothetical protein